MDTILLIAEAVTWLVVLYFVIGAVLVLAIIVSFFDKDDVARDMRAMWRESDLKEKSGMALILVFYGIFCWLPIAAGWMKQPINLNPEKNDE